MLNSFQALPSSSRANNNLANTNINQQIIKNINDDIELISDDDEITVNQCIKITINNNMLYGEILNNDNELNKALSLNNNESLYEAISDDDNEPNPALPSSDNDLCINHRDMVDDVNDYEQQLQQSLTKKRQYIVEHDQLKLENDEIEKEICLSECIVIDISLLAHSTTDLQ